ncbi:NUDIX domain-containing protein [Xanthobacter oligotrophicus]|uniref:NUDIX domain-containing protein n=1 Tax=Xanthobacter oligotrophicus TaxID=2607286 RepID=UPI0011F3A0EC|nr:NUDIX domain-containing protein [Xanthobacter oligotrophicus]MCG5234751.1 NUDIX domain-containing protein [Xanthobacter oligotrophicus]
MLPLFHFLRRLRHGMTLGVRVLAVDDAERVLLVRHSYVAGWHLPGGGVDVGESAEAAARRELKEEANVEADGPLALAGVFFNPRVGGRDHVVLYRTSGLIVGPRPERNLEIVAAEFFAPDALPEDMSPATGRRVAEWRGAPASDRW